MLKKQKKAPSKSEGCNAVFRIANSENTGIMIPTIISNNVNAWHVSEMVSSCVPGIKDHGNEAGGLTEWWSLEFQGSLCIMSLMPHPEVKKGVTMVARLGGM